MFRDYVNRKKQIGIQCELFDVPEDSEGYQAFDYMHPNFKFTFKQILQN